MWNQTLGWGPSIPPCLTCGHGAPSSPGLPLPLFGGRFRVKLTDLSSYSYSAALTHFSPLPLQGPTALPAGGETMARGLPGSGRSVMASASFFLTSHSFLCCCAHCALGASFGEYALGPGANSAIKDPASSKYLDSGSTEFPITKDQMLALYTLSWISNHVQVLYSNQS